MSERLEVVNELVVGGKPLTLRLLSHPVIDDVLLAQAKIAAYEMENGSADPTRRVDRGVRDYLIRLGVER